MRRERERVGLLSPRVRTPISGEREKEGHYVDALRREDERGVRREMGLPASISS